MSDYGRETIAIIQIDQPRCSRVYGDGVGSPSVPGGCQAMLGVTGERKCFNTRFTCQDSTRYDPETLTLSFGREQQDIVRHYGYVLPALLTNPEVAPGAINLGGMFDSVSALGERERVTLKMADFLHSDLLVDKYRLERATGAAQAGSPIGDPYDPYTQGTFWGKWLARNPYHTGYPLRVYEGFLGDAIEDMRVRHYVIDRIDGPTKGEVSIIAKDLFSLIESQKAVAPTASRGGLTANLTGSPASFVVEPAGIGNLDYLTSGHVQIGDEIIAYTRSADTFTITGRAQFGTEQDDHDEEDLVQQVLVYNAQLAHNIVHDLLCRFTTLGETGSPTGSPYINKALWDLRAEQMTDQFTGRVSKPTPVKDLIAELAVQAGFSVWPDVSTGMIEFVALRAGTISPTVNDRDFIVDGSLSTKRDVDRRLTQIWVYYGMINPAEDLDERRNYRSRLVTVDPELEEPELYGTPQIKEIFSRWIPQFGRSAAERCGERLLAMFRDPPLRASFTVHASRHDELDLARYFALQTADIQDESGAEASIAMATTRMKRGENEIAIEAHSIAFDEEVDNGIREIYIENDDHNLNLREIHDLIYATPVGGSPGEVVEFYVLSDVVIGSTSTGVPAIETGSWPAGVSLRLINAGRIQGKGGNGGNANSGVLPANGQSGQAGGTALKASAYISVDNTGGEIWGGGGGGAAGGSACFEFDSGDFVFISGGGGGAGAGTDPATGGAVGLTNFGSQLVIATGGGNSTPDSGGAAGVGGNDGFGDVGGAGGAGGGPGIAGGNGGNGFGGSVHSVNGSPYDGDGGTGGAAGKYIEGNAFVTWIANGDRRGGVA